MPNRSLTDNWLIQLCAELLSRKNDPLETAHWAKNNRQAQSVETPEIRSGALRVLALCTFIEQIVFSDEILVMEEWTKDWLNIHPQLDALLTTGQIKEVQVKSQEYTQRKDRYLNEICREKYIQDIHTASMEAYARGQPDYIGQVINGSCSYLAIADTLELQYYPHPVRAWFLESSLYSPTQTGGQNEGTRVFEKLIHETKINLIEKYSPHEVVSSFSRKMSSVALYCLLQAETPEMILPTAFQLKSDQSFMALRDLLNELHRAIMMKDEAKTQKITDALEKAITHTRDKLGLSQDQISRSNGSVTIFNIITLPIRLPGILTRELFPPRHSTVVHKLLAGNKINDLAHALDKNFGIKSKEVLEDITRFADRSLA